MNTAFVESQFSSCLYTCMVLLLNAKEVSNIGCKGLTTTSVGILTQLWQVPVAQLKNRSISKRGSWTWVSRDGIAQSESKSLDSTGVEMDPKVSMLVTQTDPDSVSPQGVSEAHVHSCKFLQKLLSFSNQHKRINKKDKENHSSLGTLWPTNGLNCPCSQSQRGMMGLLLRSCLFSSGELECC